MGGGGVCPCPAVRKFLWLVIRGPPRGMDVWLRGHNLPHPPSTLGVRLKATADKWCRPPQISVPSVLWRGCLPQDILKVTRSQE